MKNLSLYGKFIIVLVTSSFVITTFFCDYAKAGNALKLYVWDFGTREGTKNTLTKNLTQEFEEALIQKKCCLVLERRRYDRILSQKKNEEAISKIKGISLENQDKLKLLLAEAVVFGEVYDDTDSGEIKIAVSVQTFDSVNIASESIRFSRGKRLDAASREENMQKLVEKLCPSLVPSPVPSPVPSSNQKPSSGPIIILVEDLEQPQPEVTQKIAYSLNTVSTTYDYDNVHVRKLGYSIPETTPIKDIVLKTTPSFKLPKLSFNALKDENIPDDILGKLKPLENQEVTGEKDFLNAVAKHIGEEQTVRYEKLILKHAEISFNNANYIGILIGGRYEQTPQGGILHVHLRIVNLPTFMPGFIQNFHFSFQPQHPSEIAYFSYFIVGVSRLAVKDWRGADIQFSKSLNQLAISPNQDIESTVYALRGMAYIGRGKMNSGYDDFEQAKKSNPSIDVPIQRTGLGSILITGLGFILIVSIIIIAFVVIWLGIKRIKDKPRVHYNRKTKTLTSALGIETLGLQWREKTFSIILENGTKIPQRHTEGFTTTSDNQTVAEIHVLQGLHPLARYNRSVGKLLLKGIAPAPRGVPQISVTFYINSKGVLHVQAKDLGTGQTIEHEFIITSGL